MRYIVDDRSLEAGRFLEFVNGVWPGEYDMEKTQAALSKTLNITAYDGERPGGVPKNFVGRILFWDYYGAACSAGASKTRRRQQAAAACQGKHADHALFWCTAGCRGLLRKERMQEEP